MTEKELLAAVMQMAGLLGWLAYHPHDSRHSAAGFPDCTLVHPYQRRLLWAELKSARGKMTDQQRTWSEHIIQAGGEWFMWTPSDYHAGTIERILRGGAA
jgi:hypothetical protein